MRIVWTRRFLQELEAIGDYIAEHSPQGAHRTVNQIHTKTDQLLAANPFIGRVGEIEGTRELIITNTPYIVAYRVTDTQVEVLFVQHGAQEWPEEVD